MSCVAASALPPARPWTRTVRVQRDGLIRAKAGQGRRAFLRAEAPASIARHELFLQKASKGLRAIVSKTSSEPEPKNAISLPAEGRLQSLR
jgi:hypothetical protein